MKGVCNLIIIASLLAGCSVKYATKDGHDRLIGFVFLKQKSHEKPCMIYKYSDNIGLGLDFTAESGGFHVGRKQINTVYLLNNASIIMKKNGKNLPQFDIEHSLSGINDLLPECHPAIKKNN